MGCQMCQKDFLTLVCPHKAIIHDNYICGYVPGVILISVS